MGRENFIYRCAKKLATILNTTVGYLLDETDQENVLKDPDPDIRYDQKILKRLLGDPDRFKIK